MRQTGKTDYIVLGSSPAAILHAAALKRRGYSVRILEKEEVIGGSWSAVPMFNLGLLEKGCHVLAPTENPEKDKRTIDHLNEIGISVNKVSRPALKEVNKSFVADLPERQFYYFSKGVPGLLKELDNFLKEEDIRIEFGQKVEDLEVKDSQCFCRCGEVSWAADSLLLTSFSGIEGIHAESGPFDLEYEKRLSYHINFLIKSREVLNFFHLWMEDDRYIDRISCITDYCEELAEGYSVFSARVSYKAKEAGSIDVDFAREVFKYLIGKKIFGSDAQLKDVYIADYEMYYRSTEVTDKIKENLPSNIHLLESLDLMKTFNNYSGGWLDAFKQKQTVTS